MKNSKFWLIPGLFFLVVCVLNLIGCLTDGSIETVVKPSLMPLLCITTLSYLLSKGVPVTRQVVLLMTAQLFGFAGDTALIGKGFLFFAGGILLFLIGHICYISLFGGQSWKGLKPLQWVLAVILMLAATAGLVFGIGVNGTMLAPMGIYALVLMVLIFSTFAGVLRPKAVKAGGRLTWCLLLLGALLFAFSDSLIAVRNFGHLSHFMDGFGVMSTYLLAQSLLAIGGVRIILKK